jgi:tetratricopeptide (TPR) repeat protein
MINTGKDNNSMAAFVRLCIFAALLSAGASAAWAGVFTQAQELRLKTYVDNIMNCRFDSAQAAADYFIKQNSSDPLGYVLWLMNIGMRDLDCDYYVDTVKFVNIYRNAVESVAELEKKNGRTSYSMTMAGFANITHASYYLQQKRYFAAVGTGLDAIKILEEAKTADSTNVEVDFFLGLYNYAKAELKRRLWMVMFWYGGDKQDGINQLIRCAKQSHMTAASARLSLADIYTQENQLEKAKPILDSLRKSYPDSRFVMWSYAKYFAAVKDTASAISEFGELSASYAGYRYGGLNSLKTLLSQVQYLCAAGRRTEAEKAALKALNGKCRDCTEQEKEICSQLQKAVSKGGCNVEN